MVVEVFVEEVGLNPKEAGANSGSNSDSSGKNAVSDPCTEREGTGEGVGKIEEENTTKSCETPVATSVCKNGLHIEHIDSGVNRERESMQRNLMTLWKGDGDKQYAGIQKATTFINFLSSVQQTPCNPPFCFFTQSTS